MINFIGHASHSQFQMPITCSNGGIKTLFNIGGRFRFFWFFCFFFFCSLVFFLRFAVMLPHICYRYTLIPTFVVRCLHLSVPAKIFRGCFNPDVLFWGHWSISTRRKSISIPDVPLGKETEKKQGVELNI